MEEKNNEMGCECKICQKWGWCPAGKCHKIIKIIIIIIILFFVGKLIFGGHDYNKNNLQQNTIVVSGKGEITVKPDIATISFSVLNENMDVSKASDAVNTQIAKIVATLKADGIADADIKTTDYSVYPQYNYVNTANSTIYPYESGTQVLAGYNVSQGITIKIRDLTKASKVVTDLGTLNVTNMSGLSFTEDKYDALVKQARDQAIQQARTDAESLAKSLGVRLDKIVGFSEGGNYPVYYDKATLGMGGSSNAAAPAVLPTGENTITSNVSITYEIK